MELKTRLPPWHAITSIPGTKAIVYWTWSFFKVEPLLCGAEELMLLLDSDTVSDSGSLLLANWKVVVMAEWLLKSIKVTVSVFIQCFASSFVSTYHGSGTRPKKKKKVRRTHISYSWGTYNLVWCPQIMYTHTWNNYKRNVY